MNPIKKILKNLIWFFTLPSRIKRLERVSFNRRLYAVEQIAQYLVGAKLEGDYLEFGVYEGLVYCEVYRWLYKIFPKMRFFAFDSFEGLPAPKGVDNLGGYSSNYHPNEFACSLNNFRRNLKKNKVDLKRVELVKGWYDKTLIKEKAKKYKIKQAAFIWIDSDLYESAVPVLKFITPYLVTGTVIVFDDWHAFRNDPARGEQRACREWLKKNSGIKLLPLFSYGYGGMVFTVLKKGR